MHSEYTPTLHLPQLMRTTSTTPPPLKPALLTPPSHAVHSHLPRNPEAIPYILGSPHPNLTYLIHSVVTDPTRFSQLMPQGADCSSPLAGLLVLFSPLYPHSEPGIWRSPTIPLVQSLPASPAHSGPKPKPLHNQASPHTPAPPSP